MVMGWQWDVDGMLIRIIWVIYDMGCMLWDVCVYMYIYIMDCPTTQKMMQWDISGIVIKYD